GVQTCALPIFVAALGRRVLDVIQQLPGIFHLGTRGRIHLDKIDEAAFVDFETGRALITGFGTDPHFAVETLGQNSRNGGLAHPPRASEKISVVQAPLVQGIDQCREHMLLPYHLAKDAWTPFSCQYLVAHEGVAWGLS